MLLAAQSMAVGTVMVRWVTKCAPWHGICSVSSQQMLLAILHLDCEARAASHAGSDHPFCMATRLRSHVSLMWHPWNAGTVTR